MLTRLDLLVVVWIAKIDGLRDRTDGERSESHERRDLHWIQVGGKVWWTREEGQAAGRDPGESFYWLE